MNRRVAIIGAGPAGLAAAKSLLESGIEPIVFEKTTGIGGLWNPQSGAMWDSLRTNLSRHTCMFSDFPWPARTVDFPGHLDVHAYLERYADAFGLRPYIKLQTPVTRLIDGGRDWEISTPKSREKYDAVIIASGFFASPDQPAVSHNTSFIHSHDYRRPADFADKDVIVVGNSFSGAEIAAEISHAARSVTHIFRRAAWIIPRYLPAAPGIPPQPMDLSYQLAKWQADRQMDAKARYRLTAQFFREAYGDQASVHPALAIETPDDAPIHVAISDDYLARVRQGAIHVHRADIATLHKNGVILADGSHPQADCAIAATGYRLALPYMNEELKKRLSFKADDKLQPLPLFKGTFHPHAPGLAFIGMYKGPFFGTIELQARWAAAVFSGQVRLPSREQMICGLRGERALRWQQPRPQFPHGDYIGFSQTLAAEIGVQPCMAADDPLAGKILHGPFSPAHYRLHGPGAKPELARHILHALPG